MNKALKIAGITGGVIVALLAGVLLLAKMIITPERVKKTVIPLAQKALHRPVRLGDIKVSIFSGIVLNNVVIMEKEGEETFVAVDLVKLRYQFWPLLSKRIVVDEISMETPRIRIVKLPDGSFNFSDIMKKEKTAPVEQPKEKADIDLLVSTVAVSKGELVYEDKSKQAAAPSRYTLSAVEFTSNDISPKKPIPFKAKASFSGASLEVEGKIADATEKPALDAVFRVVDADLKKLMAGMPAELAAKAKAYDPAGIINVSLTLAGPVAAPKELLKSGEVRMKDVSFSVSGQRPVLSGKLVLKGDTVTSEDLVLSLGKERLTIALAAANLFGKPVSITSTVKADKFDLAPFISKKESAEGTAGAAKPEPAPMKLPVKATGSVSLGQTSYKGLPVSQLLLKYRLANNVLDIDQFSGQVAGGTFSDTARIDLGRQGYVYSTRLTVQGVQADPVVTAFSPKAAGTIFGTMALNAQLNGSGIRDASLKKNLAGQGDFAVTNGKLTGAGMVQKLATFLNLEQLRVIRFNKFAGTFRVSGGKAVLDSDVAGSDVRLTPTGTVGLDKSLDMSLVTRISPELTGKVARGNIGGNIGQFLTDEKGWGVLPVKVGGTTSAPKFRLDASMVGGQLRTKAREKLQQTIEQKLMKRKEGEPKAPEQELIERGLKGIFGR
ncbi:AsmA family protein [Pelotalea chapellei]|uniref:AsmA family protein n=1 Tax=Pelotalea chapellei TaxID=44671 RepID=A0ABS5UB45_9BACT|nr:AsmA family protein [Pelotalea chapellei]